MPTALEIVTPEKLVLAQDVDMVVIPSADGEMGVMAGHAPMIVLLRGGAIRLYEGNNVTNTLFVSSGFAEVTPERCTVLANAVQPVTEISRRMAEEEVAQAQQAFESMDKMDPIAFEGVRSRMESANAMLALAQAP